MPGDLRDPEQWMPFHYDDRYEPGTNKLEPQLEPLDNFIQRIAQEVLGYKLDKETLVRVKRHLDDKGFLHRNWGDQAFHDEVSKYLRNLMTVRKVARNARSK